VDWQMANTSPFKAIEDWFLSPWIENLNTAVAAVSGKVGPLLTACVGIYFMFEGYRIIFQHGNHDGTFEEFFKKVIKASVICAFVLGADVYKTYVVDVAIDYIPNGLSQLVTSTSVPNATVFDALSNKVGLSLAKIWKEASGWAPWTYIYVGLRWFTLLLLSTVLLLAGFAYTTMIKACVYMVLLFGPAFIMTKLFDQTASYFNNFISTLVTLAIHQALVIAFMGLMMSTIDKALDVDADAGFYQLLYVFGFGLIFLRAMPSIASRLGNGVAWTPALTRGGVGSSGSHVYAQPAALPAIAQPWGGGRAGDRGSDGLSARPQAADGAGPLIGASSNLGAVRSGVRSEAPNNSSSGAQDPSTANVGTPRVSQGAQVVPVAVAQSEKANARVDPERATMEAFAARVGPQMDMNVSDRDSGVSEAARRAAVAASATAPTLGASLDGSVARPADASTELQAEIQQTVVPPRSSEQASARPADARGGGMEPYAVHEAQGLGERSSSVGDGGSRPPDAPVARAADGAAGNQSGDVGRTMAEPVVVSRRD
jgi:type IV secretion system protein VirB6